jgi:AraC family transcriptional regulator
MRPQTERTYQERILRVLVHIQQHLDDALPLEELARVACFSPYHFHRIFEGMVGESVKEHIRRLRLERAAYRLQFTDQPVTRIAFDAGYEAHESFTRAFRAMFGEAPSQFRQSQRTLLWSAAPSKIHFVPDGKLDPFHIPQRGDRPMEVRIERVEPMRVAFMRHVGPYMEVGALWGKLMSWAGPRGLLGPQATLIGIGHDDPHVTPADKLRYDACLVVDPHFQPEGEVGVQEIGGGDYAVTRHREPYEKLGETYARLYGEWLPASGREPRSAPAFEIYRNTPMDTAPADLITDIYVPVEG